MGPSQLIGWLGPSLLLIVGVVIYPLVEAVRASFENINLTGAVVGNAGLANYRFIVDSPDTGRVVLNTLIWVGVSVAATTLIALPLGQLLASEYWAARVARVALIVPWACSVVMTSLVFGWILNYYYGALNRVLVMLHAVRLPVDWLVDPATSRWAMIGVVVFISLPFTSFTLLAGLMAIPEEVVEAAHLDGAGGLSRYRYVVLPLLRGPLTVTVLLNSIWIFNSFPIIYILNGSNPGYGNDTTITYMYKLSFITAQNIGAGAAMSVLNVVALGVVMTLFVRKVGLD